MSLKYEHMIGRKMLQRRNKLADRCIDLLGVHAVTWWESDDDDSPKGLTVVLHHRWWTWRGLRDRNRAAVVRYAASCYSESWAYVEVM